MKKTFLIIILFFCIFSGFQIFSRTEVEFSNFVEDYFEYAQSAMEKWNVPGMAIGIVEKSGRVSSKGFGVRNLDTGEKVDENTVFQIGSTSKAFTSFLMARLVEKGCLNWDDRVTDYFPEFELSDSWVTWHFLIKDLMAQHSGLYPYAGDSAAIMGYGREKLLEGMKYIALKRNFRSDFTYVNNMFLVAAKVIESTTGKSYEQNLTDEIFKILGMESTSSDKSVFLTGGNVASMYSVLSYKDGSGDHNSLYKLDPRSVLFNWPYVYAPAGGINSNITDMSKWLLMHLNSGEYLGNLLIGKDGINFLYSPQTVALYGFDRALYYAQGWINEIDYGKTVIWHNGSTTGCRTYIGFMPEYGIGIVILSNLGSTDLPDLLGKDFFTSYISGEKSEIALNSYTEPVIEDISQVYFSEFNPKYTGGYYNDFYGRVEFVFEDSEYKLIMGPGPVVLECIPTAEGEFAITWLDSGFPLIGNIRFEEDEADGETMMTIDFSENEGTGKFIKTDRGM